MANILIISDSEILSHLYKTNIEVYLNFSVELHSDYDILSTPFSADALIVFGRLSNVGLNAKQVEVLNKIAKSKLVIAIGAKDVEALSVFNIEKAYKINEIIKKMATSFGITAKDMANMALPKYYEVNSQLVKKITSSPCKLYQAEGSEYVIVADIGDNLAELCQNQISKNEKFYIHVNNRLVFTNHTSSILMNLLGGEDHLDVGIKNEVIKNGFTIAVDAFSQNKQVNEEILNLGHNCSKVMAEISNDIPKLRNLLELLENSKENYLYIHMILSAYVAKHIIRKMSWGSDLHIEKTNFVLFFHDIILAPLYQQYPHLKYEEDILFDSAVSEKDKELVLNHAVMAADLIINFKKSPIGVDLLIKQHHGMTAGVGFAIDFKDDISPLAKVILISESFVEEFLRKRDEEAGYHLRIEDILPLLLTKFRRQTYHVMINALSDIVI